MSAAEKAARGYLGDGAVQVYTGNGKGKTTAALGLAMRAVGRGLRVLMIQFMKRWGYGEHLAAGRLRPELSIVQVGKPYFVAREGEIDPETRASMGEDVRVFAPGSPPEELVRGAEEGLARAEWAMRERTADIIILDEINVALHFELVSLDRVLEVVRGRPDGVELVLTGRNAPEELLEVADLVTEMREVKHYWRRGLGARRGIEE
ncbi:MAG: cob(I)yrinic acid a,c-diamide adenosyltransferase [Bacillota bacterium]